MAEKNLNSRIIHKHDIEANWVKATNFIPKQGEIIVYDIDKNYTYERFKIGDGTTLVNNLPFIKTGLEISDTEEELEEGVYLTNADQLGGISADNYALKANVVTSVNGQTGNVIITEGGGNIDTSNFYSTSNPPPYPVTSVNGSTGAITIPVIKYVDLTFTFNGEILRQCATAPSDLTSSGQIINVISHTDAVIITAVEISGNEILVRGCDSSKVYADDLTSSSYISLKTDSFSARVFYF